MIQARAVIFDFDLTLADSGAGFEACHLYAAQQIGVTPPSNDAIRRSIGTQLPLAVPMLYGDAIDGHADDYIRFYQAKADEIMGPMTVMLPGAMDVLRRLNQASIPMAIVSQKLRYRLEEVLQREGLLDSFAAVLGGEDVPDFKPDPSGLRLALDRLAVPASDAIYVGDTTIDAQAAENAELRFVAVLTGPTTREDFASHKTVAVVESVAYLPELLGL